MCDKVPIIPQNNKATCWFNVIITACCYSQGLRNIVSKASLSWDNKNSFYNFMKTILNNAYNTDKRIQDLFLEQKIEYLLYKYLQLFDKKLKKFLQNMYIYYNKNPDDISSSSRYIIKFIKNLNISCLDIIIFNNQYLIDFNKNIELVINLKKINKKQIIGEKKYEPILEFELTKKIKKPKIIKNPNVIIIHIPNRNYNDIKDELLKYTTDDFDIEINDDFIDYQGNKYILDCCILRNYNNRIGHYILGLTCGNKKYIYNSYNVNNNLCKLYEFNWNINEDKKFSFNYKNCNLNFNINEQTQQCFSFNRGDRILVYVKIDNEYLSISNKKEMKKDFYNIDKIDKYQLEQLVKNLKESYENKSIANLKNKFYKYVIK
jgi:hypothetical protein